MFDRPENINVFMLYAEEDLDLKQELEAHLSMLNQKGYIDLWHEGKIVYSKNVNAEISNYLEQAHLILLLVSSNFLALDCYGKYEEDLRKAYKRQEAGKAQVIPVILRSCVWKLGVLANLRSLPDSGFPVRSEHWENRDLAFENITMGILNIIDEMKNGSASKPPPLPFKKQKGKDANEKDKSALKLINSFFQILKHNDPGIGVQRVLPLLHKSLIKVDGMDTSFKKVKFLKAYEKSHLYKMPVEVKSKKDSGRKTIGILLDKEEGEEWIYTLEKINDLGGINGQIRIFIPANGGQSSISSISL